MPILEWRCQDINQFLPHGDHFFLSTFSSSSEVFGKNISIRSKLSTGLWRKERKVETLNLIVKSKSLPSEVNNSTIELHLPVEAKGKLAIIMFCGF